MVCAFLATFSTFSTLNSVTSFGFFLFFIAEIEEPFAVINSEALSLNTSSNVTAVVLPFSTFASLPSAASFNNFRVSSSCFILASISSLVVPMLYTEQNAFSAPDTTP